MTSTAEHFNAICKANLDLTKQCAAISLETTGQMLQVIQAARDFFGKGNEQLSGLLLDNSLIKSLADWLALYQDNVQKALDATRAYFETATKVQSEYPRLIQEQTAIANKNFTDSMQGFAKAATTGSELAASVIRHAAEPMEHKSRKAA